MRTVLAMLVVVACGKGGGDKGSTKSAPPSEILDPKLELARLDALNYAESAYPMWASQHPDKACPEKLGDLDEFLNGRETVDPWGHAYRMSCGKDLPAGAKGIGISSMGPDGEPDTADDVKSWAPGHP